MNGAPAGRPAHVPIEAVAVRHSFGEHRVLRGVTLPLAAQRLNVLLGAGGAGKTTLLRILGGLIEPSEGAVLVRGVPSTPRARRAVVGLVHSGGPSFRPDLSAAENLLFFARLHGLRRDSARARAEEVLAGVGLAEHAALQVRRFTPPMEKRLSFARALLGRPVALLVDDATRSLERAAGQALRELARSCAERGAAVLWATSRCDELDGFCDRATVLEDGRVRFEGLHTTLAARYELRVGRVRPTDAALLDEALDGIGSLSAPSEADPSRMLLTLSPGATLGDALAVLIASGVQLIACHEERTRGDRFPAPGARVSGRGGVPLIE